MIPNDSKLFLIETGLKLKIVNHYLISLNKYEFSVGILAEFPDSQQVSYNLSPYGDSRYLIISEKDSTKEMLK